MEECCAVCAEPLEWVAYGPCGHRDVCSTCTSRLRVVLDDKRCCICKQDCSVVFITKALGDYTKVVADFNSLPSRVIDGANHGDLWFDSDIGAFFDDEDEFKRIKAMCKLQCKVCEASGFDNSSNGFVRKGHVFKSIDALRRHIYGVHRLIMCELCLQGRKVFIQDQKLYTRAQLERHSSTGDSKVDGSEEERGGFGGHPMCAFCTRRFYSDNELYHHMSTEHFTCHFCQRSRPGQFDYYQNYDDLEAHFRNEHLLCEHPECLAKKFIVFSTEAELKIHNAKEHGGSLSRAQRNAALKIPVSLQFRRTGQQSQSSDNRGRSYYRGGRGHDLNAELLSAAARESVETATLEDALRESAVLSSNDASATVASNPENFPALTTDAAQSSSGNGEDKRTKYRAALHGSSQASLTESAFPPLPGASQLPQSKQRNQGHGLPMASLFADRSAKVKVLKASDRRHQAGPSLAPENRANGTQNRLSEYPDLSAARADARGHLVSAVTGRGPPPGAIRGGSGGSYQSSSSAGIDVASGQSSSTIEVTPDAGPVQLTMDEIRAATKVLIEQITAQLQGNDEQFANFKEVHSQFRKGSLTARDYYDRVAELGLSDIIPELARLCPDPQKQQELLAVMKAQASVDKHKGKSVGQVESTKNQMKAINGLKEKPPRGSVEEVEVLSTDGYRSSRSRPGKQTAIANGLSVLFKADTRAGPPQSSSSVDGEWACETCTLVNQASSSQCAACGTGRKQPTDDGKKKKKASKISKFDRMRVGESAGTTVVEEEAGSSSVGTRGAWRNGGGQRLLATVSSTDSASRSK